jgi:choline-glycine betaine transporter
MQHYLKPPTALGDTPAATREAMLITFFHWGFHAWAVYDVIDVVGEQTNRYSKDLPPERMGDHN